jgi:hypothetical protein
MLSSSDLSHTAYFLGSGEAETASQVSERLKTINRMSAHKCTVIFLKLTSSTASRIPSMFKCRCNRVGSKVLSLSFQP